MGNTAEYKLWFKWNDISSRSWPRSARQLFLTGPQMLEGAFGTVYLHQTAWGLYTPCLSSGLSEEEVVGPVNAVVKGATEGLLSTLEDSWKKKKNSRERVGCGTAESGKKVEWRGSSGCRGARGLALQLLSYADPDPKQIMEIHLHNSFFSFMRWETRK